MYCYETAIMPFTRHFFVERVTGIEPALSAWEADVLPLNYTRGVTGRLREQPGRACPDMVPDRVGCQGAAL